MKTQEWIYASHGQFNLDAVGILRVCMYVCPSVPSVCLHQKYYSLLMFQLLDIVSSSSGQTALSSLPLFQNPLNIWQRRL